MTTRPTTSPAFATAATFTSGSESGLTPRLDPGAGFKAQGMYPNRRMPARWFNFLVGLAGDWINYLSEKTDWQFNVKNFGAIGDGSNDTAALQATINAAGATPGGVVCVPDGFYCHTGLTVPEGVDLEFAPRAMLAINHATNDHLTFTGAATYLPNVIRGARFVGNVTNSGSVIRASASGSRVLVQGCSYNSLVGIATQLEGRFGRADASGARIRFENCLCDVRGALRAYEASSGGKIELVGGRIKMPATYGTQLVYVNNGSRADLLGVDIDCTAHVSGSGSVLVADSASRASVIGCRIDSAGIGLDWSSAAVVRALGNEWIGLGNRYGTGIAAEGSELELIPTGNDVNASTTYTVPNSYRSFAVRNTAGAVDPAFTLPAKHFPGQRLTLVIFNNTDAGWSGLSLVGVLTSGSLINGGTRTFELVVMDPDDSGTYEWVCVSERG